MQTLISHERWDLLLLKRNCPCQRSKFCLERKDFQWKLQLTTTLITSSQIGGRNKSKQFEHIEVVGLEKRDN